ncbi:DUF1206 domain-containing protein [Intrasporangium sp.]|uniref:DUF1206 domain-containing protein n=1 Tax=Intrasporangium sp. TaxID=1925024 RepID=UPI00293AABE4|nr:DUF1206 domain-containing protein [Intrasporangium sp.]MDV3219898.1 DUF1206 domain-containing protein [Intrasporangium sp.]
MEEHSVKQAAREAGNQDALQMAARAGYAVNGVLHLLIGWIALQVAWGLGGSGSADQSGALSALASNTVGMVILWVGVIGWLGLGLWQLIQAIVSRDEAKERLKYVAKGITYLVLSWTAFGFARGGSSSSSEQSSDFTTTLMSQPLGTALVVIVGLVVIGVGAYHVHKGWKRKFLSDLVEHPGPAVEKLARFGYIAKGVALVVVGGLFVLAAVQNDPEEATGLDGALKTMLEAPAGQWLLTLVALGFVAFGIYSLVRAKKARV